MAAPTFETVALATQQNGEAIQSLNKTLGTVVDKLSRMPMPGQPTPEQAFGTPWIRNGESSLDDSRGFSYLKMIGHIAGFVPDEQCKHERNLAMRMAKCLYADAGNDGYQWASQNRLGEKKFLAPLAPNFLQDNFVDRSFRREMKQMVAAGTDGADLGEASWIKRKMLSQQYGTKALSWLNELTGGAIVAPPEMGELIELLRNKEALVNAGARVVPLPPQGRLKYPRQTSPSNTFWVGENSPITESIVGTGEITLQAKKLAVLIKAPNELIRFASPAAEALLRDDMTKSLALGLDLAGLEGQGSDVKPRGVINYPGINRIQSSQIGVNSGGVVVGQDIYRMIAAVEESDAEFEAYIMRPKTLYKYYQLRADAVVAGDAAGPYLFNLIREAQDDTPASLAGYPVVKSTQVSQTRSYAAATNLTYVVGGMWSDMLIGMFGAIEFAATTMGDTAFVNDQTWVRGILSADVQLRHEAAFVLLDNLNTLVTAAS
jgi:HK97 family phage major capsid protein